MCGLSRRKTKYTYKEKGIAMPREKSKTDREWFSHRERADGTRDLSFGDHSSEGKGHAVIDKNGTVKYLREKDGRTIADDRKS